MEVSVDATQRCPKLILYRTHVFQDLQPYVCLDVACAGMGYTFARRRDWACHIRERHWMEYSCPFQPCASSLSDSSSFKMHVEISHADDLTVYGLTALLNLARVERKWVDLECPFCCKTQNSAAVYLRHLGWHMEKLSLFALPLVGDEVSGVTYEHEETPSIPEDRPTGVFFPPIDLSTYLDVDDKDSDGSETTHEDFGDADEPQGVADSVKEGTL